MGDRVEKPVWPKHADGTPKKVGEMTRDEARTCFADAAQRVKAELEAPAVQKAISDLLSHDHAFKPDSYGVCKICGEERH
jgi:hypothetical protein